ncbi:adenylate cyclase type 2-like isoform X2 [Pteropus vampyrus]|uniref:Adenylate cyclase type 2-like isoform X2 n=1 Tax=Pteropus vampyrus TaxID=132908 RepID=A0A6P6BVP9_PTEVA|nr:adenylate cyclase type 2-like isoform X2 [Pteropus vampyrus]
MSVFANLYFSSRNPWLVPWSSEGKSVDGGKLPVIGRSLFVWFELSHRVCVEVEDHVAFLITVPTALAIFFAIFILVCIESVFKKLLRLFSVVIWLCLVAMAHLFMCFGGTVSPWDQVTWETNSVACVLEIGSEQRG